MSPSLSTTHNLVLVVDFPNLVLMLVFRRTFETRQPGVGLVFFRARRASSRSKKLAVRKLPVFLCHGVSLLVRNTSEQVPNVLAFEHAALYGGGDETVSIGSSGVRASDHVDPSRKVR